VPSSHDATESVCIVPIFLIRGYLRCPSFANNLSHWEETLALRKQSGCNRRKAISAVDEFLSVQQYWVHPSLQCVFRASDTANNRKHVSDMFMLVKIQQPHAQRVYLYQTFCVEDQHSKYLNGVTVLYQNCTRSNVFFKALWFSSFFRERQVSSRFINFLFYAHGSLRF